MRMRGLVKTLTAQSNERQLDLRFLQREPADVYHAKAREHLSSHSLRDFRRCPLLFRKKELGLIKDADTTAFQVGRAAHVLVLEGRPRFEAEFAVGGPIIQTEEGINDIDVDHFPLATKYGDVLNAISALYSEEHDYQTVVIDSLDWLERLIWADVCAKRGVESIEDIGYAKGYVFALAQWREILSGLDALRNDPLKVLSLGAGVQSTTVLLMSCRGVLPKLDAAVFADTQWEPAEVYAHLEWLTAEAAHAGIPVHRVTNGDLRKHTLEGFVRGSSAEGQRYASLPLFVLNPNGSRGMVRRQCTREYKIVPIERFIRRELLGLNSGQRAPDDAVDQWFGISADEMRRVRFSRDHWKRNVYPLIGLPEQLLDRPYSRRACQEWLSMNYPGREVPRSACIGCPYHTNHEWRRIKDNPHQWADAVEIDRAIRNADGMNGQVYLHHTCTPLEEVDLRTDEEKGQMILDFRAECLGYCGN